MSVSMETPFRIDPLQSRAFSRSQRAVSPLVDVVNSA
jgi:hypothetical protein